MHNELCYANSTDLILYVTTISSASLAGVCSHSQDIRTNYCFFFHRCPHLISDNNKQDGEQHSDAMDSTENIPVPAVGSADHDYCEKPKTAEEMLEAVHSRTRNNMYDSSVQDFFPR